MESAIPKAKSRTPPTKRKSRTAKLSKEQLLIALQKKKECNARAQKIIEESLDPIPTEDVVNFLSNLIHLNQAHYDDIIEERSISTLCGYPLCDMTLADIPKQQFIISQTQNKVYDITERKKFCSSNCYKSSVYLREQILTTPLWVRKEDDIIPEFKLLSFEDKVNGGDKHGETDAEIEKDKAKANKNEKNTKETESLNKKN